MGPQLFKVLSAKDEIAPLTNTAGLIFDETGLVRTALVAEKADKEEETDLVRHSCESSACFRSFIGRHLDYFSFRHEVHFKKKCFRGIYSNKVLHPPPICSHWTTV